MKEDEIRRIKELSQYYSGMIRKVERFPSPLPPKERLKERLLGWYSAIVEARGHSVIYDDNTLSKIDKVVKWMSESSRRGLLLCGTMGNGKTTMLVTLKRFFGDDAILYDAQTLYDLFGVKHCVPSLAANKVLIIDDLGTEPDTYNDFGQMRYPLAELLQQRYKDNATTIIATNLTYDRIGEVYGDRVKDRMHEMFAQIVYTEKSYR